LLVGVKPGAALDAKRQKAKNKKKFGPPAINDPDQSELLGKK